MNNSVREKNDEAKEAAMKILKRATCSSISGKCQLTYQIGCDADSKIYFRVIENDGGGFFSDEWVALEDIREVLESRPEDMPITSFFLYPLFRGKSVNTPSFLLAVLKNEKLIEPIRRKQRSHKLMDPEPFLERVNKLITGKSRAAPKKKVVKKSVKKKAKS